MLTQKSTKNEKSNVWFCIDFTFVFFRACLQLRISFGPDLVGPFRTLSQQFRRFLFIAILSNQVNLKKKGYNNNELNYLNTYMKILFKFS